MRSQPLYYTVSYERETQKASSNLQSSLTCSSWIHLIKRFQHKIGKTWMHTQAHARTYVHVHSHPRTHTCTRALTPTHAHMYTCTHTHAQCYIHNGHRQSFQWWIQYFLKRRGRGPINITGVHILTIWQIEPVSKKKIGAKLEMLECWTNNLSYKCLLIFCDLWRWPHLPLHEPLEQSFAADPFYSKI